MLLQRQASEERDEHIDMTPMVDVVFQLMTFMLFSMQLTGGEEVNVPPARYGVGVERDGSIFVSVLPPSRAGGEPRLSLGLGDGPPATIEQVHAAVAEAVRRGETRVVLQADGAVPHRTILDLTSALADIEGISLHIGVQERTKGASSP
jgi:biopolymer transport protein ExbD